MAEPIIQTRPCSNCLADLPEETYPAIKQRCKNGRLYRSRQCQPCINARVRKKRTLWTSKQWEYQRAKNREYDKHRGEDYKIKGKAHREAIRSRVLQAYGGRCARCGETIREFLSVDHVNNDRQAHEKTSGKKASGASLYAFLIREGFPGDRFQLLCYNCNVTKEIERRPVAKHEIQKRHNVRLRNAVLEAYGGRCACCGNVNHRVLSIDHVNNDGAEHRARLGNSGSGAVYRWLRHRGFPKDGFQLLCFNCNYAKGHYGKCPHATMEISPKDRTLAASCREALVLPTSEATVAHL